MCKSEKIARLETRIDKLQAQYDAMTVRRDKLDDRLDALDLKLHDLEDRLEKLKRIGEYHE